MALRCPILDSLSARPYFCCHRALFSVAEMKRGLDPPPLEKAFRQPRGIVIGAEFWLPNTSWGPNSTVQPRQRARSILA